MLVNAIRVGAAAFASSMLAGISVLHAGPALFDLSFVLASYFLWHRAPGRVGHSIAVAHAEREPLPA